MEDLNSGKSLENLGEPTVPTPDSVLEAAIESKIDKPLSPMGETVLLSEATKPKVGEISASIKSAPIDTNAEVQSSDRTDQVGDDVRPTPIQTAAANDVQSVKVITVPIEVEKSGLAATAATLGKFLQYLISQNTSVNESTVINQLGKKVFAATEREIMNSVINSDLVKESTTSILTNSVSLLKEATSTDKVSEKSNIEKATSIEDLIMSTFLPDDFKQAFSQIGVSIKGPESVLAKENRSAQSESAKPVEAETESVVNLKSAKLADSTFVKQILTPDKTLEKSVSKLTRELPESINNLSSSFSTFSPQSSSVTNVTNQGARIDQSSTVNSVQPSTGKISSQNETAPATKEAIGMNQSDFYLQAIYAALVSGKIRVKIENV